MKKLGLLLFFIFLHTLPNIYAQDAGGKIQVDAVLTILDGKMEEFKSAARACIQAVKERDKGTMQYDWFIDEEKGICTVRETYASSTAVLEHMGNLTDELPQLFATCTMKLRLYGTPTEELMSATAGTDIEVFPHLLGGLD
jgi:quinol monooxygenase YgiN